MTRCDKTDMTGALVRIEAPHFVAGLVIGAECAPILRYMAGWSYARIAGYCGRRDWAVCVVAGVRQDTVR